MFEPPVLPQHETQIFIALGNLTVEWNNIEDRLRSLLTYFAHPQTGDGRRGHLAVHIITIEMGTVGITQALKAIADSLDTTSKDAIEWIAEYYDRLRAYRNYYMHGITLAAPSSDLGPLGVIIMTSAKGELAQDKDFISVEQIYATIARTTALQTYIQQALNNLAWTADPKHPERRRPQLPEPPPMPERLKKSRAYPLRPSPPPDKPAASS